jgi:hypothetical protein
MGKKHIEALSAPFSRRLQPGRDEPPNNQVLEMVAEPVEITGEVERQGELLILRADPATYRKL